MQPANPSRRELVAGGMRDDKVMRIVGLASTVLFDKQNAYNPINRRISIVIMNKRTEEEILADGKVVEIEDSQELEGGALGAKPAAVTAR